LSGLGYWYYQDSQTRIETLRENNAQLEVAVETSNKTIDNMVEQSELNQERITKLSNSLRNAEQYNSELRRLFQEHNLTLLAEEKPGLIENRINEATNEVFDSIMQSTRSR
jgi:polyhydroxyalkanoate synthesis regulator phasin